MRLDEIGDDKLGPSNINSDYLTLVEGANKIRIVSTFAMRHQHYRQGECVGEGCPTCQEIDEKTQKKKYPSTQFMCWVIDRKDGLIKLAQLGITIIKQLKALAKDSQYKFDTIPSYDVTINRVGTGLETEYTVVPDRADTPLTDGEAKEIAKLKSVEKIVEKIVEKKRKELGLIIQVEDDSVQPPPAMNEEEEIDVADIPF